MNDALRLVEVVNTLKDIEKRLKQQVLRSESYVYYWNCTDLWQHTTDPRFKGVELPRRKEVKILLNYGDVSHVPVTAVKTGENGWLRFRSPVTDRDLFVYGTVEVTFPTQNGNDYLKLLREGKG